MIVYCGLKGQGNRTIFGVYFVYREFEWGTSGVGKCFQNLKTPFV